MDSTLAKPEAKPKAKETPRCPQCDSEEFVTKEYDYGIDFETGYSDSGTIARCLKCGFQGEIEEFLGFESEG